MGAIGWGDMLRVHDATEITTITEATDITLRRGGDLGHSLVGGRVLSSFGRVSAELARVCRDGRVGQVFLAISGAFTASPFGDARTASVPVANRRRRPAGLH